MSSQEEVFADHGIYTDTRFEHQPLWQRGRPTRLLEWSPLHRLFARRSGPASCNTRPGFPGDTHDRPRYLPEVTESWIQLTFPSLQLLPGRR